MSASTGSTTAGKTGYSLTCSVTLFIPNGAPASQQPLPPGVPPPTFEWFFNGSSSLPSGVTAMPTTKDSTSEIYTGMLQFSPLSQFHEGSYTCRVGAVSLMRNTMVTVNGMHVCIYVLCMSVAH